MELQPGNIDAFIRHCIWNAENDRRTSIDNFLDVSSDDEQNSLYDQYINKDDDTFQDVQSFVSSTNTTNTPSLCSENDTETSYFNESDEDINTTTTSTESNATNDIYLNGDSSPKSFLQISGIIVGNYNMGCNFHASTAIRIMIQHNISVLAIQEHTAWNRNLMEYEIKSIEKHCDRWGYFVYIHKLQILIIDKQLLACHINTCAFKEGRILVSRFQISHGQCATFIPVYGIPHSKNGINNILKTQDADENIMLREMAEVQSFVRDTIRQAYKTNDYIFVFGDMQDTPDNSNIFHIGKCRIPKHPLGIIKECESAELTCTIYGHLDDLEKPIISRHGPKGGRFIDSMYACSEGIEKVMKIRIINDTGINSDHSLILSNIDLGLKKFEISKDKEERIDFKRILSIPVHYKHGSTHPTLNSNV